MGIDVQILIETIGVKVRQTKIIFRKLRESKKSLVTVTDEDGIMNFLSDFESRNNDLKFELQMKRLWNKYCNRKMDEKNKSIEVSYEKLLSSGDRIMGVVSGL